MSNIQKQLILALLAYGATRDVDPQQVCKLAGLDYTALQRETQPSITPAQMESLWKNLAHLSNDPLFGLHFGESMQLAALGVVGQVVQTSQTVGEALSNAGALVGLLTNLISLQVEQGPKRFTIHLLADTQQSEAFPFTYRHMVDYLMAFIVHELDGLLLHKIQPQTASLPYPLPTSYEYERVLRCPVKQRQKSFTIELDNHYLGQTIISANYELQQQLLQQVSLLQIHPTGGPFQTRVFNYLLTNSYLYSLSLEAVAANFNVSPRTLQRKLKEEGVSFLQIVERVRQKLAVNYLASGHYAIKDVAYTLGYNEPSAFIRAFKKWTGYTPATYIHKQATVGSA